MNVKENKTKDVMWIGVFFRKDKKLLIQNSNSGIVGDLLRHTFPANFFAFQ